MFQKKYLIDYILDKLVSIFEEVIVVTNNPEKIKHRQDILIKQDADHWKGMGPLVGIYTGLSLIKTDKAFITACDMPLTNIKIIAQLVHNFIKLNTHALISRFNNKIEPLLAIYSTQCIQPIRHMLEVNNTKTQNIIKYVTVSYFDLKDKNQIINLNTLEDMNEFKKNFNNF